MNKNLIVLYYPKTEKENIHKNLPLSLLKIGSELKGSGYDIFVIDERFEEDYEDIIQEHIERIICLGVSVMTGYQIYGALRISSFLKNVDKRIPVVWGGWHPSILPNETLNNKNIDIVVRGQGEATIRDLVRSLKDGGDLKNIKGISYKQNGTLFSNPERELKDLNGFQPICYDIIDLKKYIFKCPMGKRTIFWNSSQGCPYNCGFCSTPTVYCRKWSGLKAHTLLEQVEVLVNNFQVDAISFADDNFLIDFKRVEEFCRGLVNAKVNIRWSTDVRIDQINRLTDEQMQLLKESGCYKLYIGAESGDQEVLKLINKKISLEDTYKAAEKLDRYEIISEFFMIVGFPLNPQKDLENSLKLTKEVKTLYPDHQFTPFLYTPYPGTPLMDLSIKHGLKVPDSLEGWSDWDILTVNTPWVDEKYLDCINMYSKCFYPLAFPSSSLKNKFSMGLRGLPYLVLHKMASFRVRNNFFKFPIEWKLIKTFHKLLLKYKLLKNVESFR